MTHLLTDADGTEFDPFEHNLLDNPPRPELTKKGLYRKVRGKSGNDADLIERWNESLVAQIDAAVEVEVDYVDAKESMADGVPADDPVSIDIHSLASDHGADVIVSGDNARFTKGQRAIGLNLKNYSTERELVEALKRHGF